MVTQLSEIKRRVAWQFKIDTRKNDSKHEEASLRQPADRGAWMNGRESAEKALKRKKENW
jgi:hypothetical protein